jgi:hypothetical protein
MWMERQIAQSQPICLVAERHWDEVGWAIAENAWRFETVINEVL